MHQIIWTETIYMLIICILSFSIFLTTRKLYGFSQYKGIKYYSNAFLYLTIGFIIRYIVMILKIISGNLNTIQNLSVLTTIMEFILILPGFFLFYSMIWQKFENIHFSKKISKNSLLIYIVAVIISAGDLLIGEFYLMYASQIILFSLASFFSMKNYLRKKNKFGQLNFISMILFMIVWIINFIAQYTIDIIPIIRVYAYLFTVSAIIILSYVNLKLTRDFA